MAKLFVTGGAGFIGSHLVDKLLSDGNEVTVYDNLCSGDIENIKPHMDKKGVSFIEADLLDLETLKNSLRGHEVVWHLGANTDIPGGIANTDLDLKSCTIATYNVLEAMRLTDVKDIIFTSSSTVYGDTEPIPLVETLGPLLPISLYGAGKLAGEGLISSFCHLFDMRACIFRFGNVIGNHMGHGVIYDFIHKLRDNPEEMEILGDGNQEKNYFMVEDCIEGMQCAFKNSTAQYDVFNLGSDTTVKVRDIARIVAEEMEIKEPRFRYTGGKRGWPGDVPVVKYNLDKMAKLGWRAKHTSEEAVRIATRRLLGKEKE